LPKVVSVYDVLPASVFKVNSKKGDLFLQPAYSGQFQR